MQVRLTSEATDLSFGRSLQLRSDFVYASSEDSDETTHLHRLVWACAARMCEKYQYMYLMTRLIIISLQKEPFDR